MLSTAKMSLSQMMKETHPSKKLNLIKMIKYSTRNTHNAAVALPFPERVDAFVYKQIRSFR